MRFMCRIEILLRKSKRKSDTAHYLPQHQQARFMKNRNCLTEFRKSFWPVFRRKITVIGRPESLLNVCGLAWVQAAQPGSAITAGFGFPCLRKVKERNTLSEQLVYNDLRHAMITQINKAKVLKGFSNA